MRCSSKRLLPCFGTFVKFYKEVTACKLGSKILMAQFLVIFFLPMISLLFAFATGNPFIIIFSCLCFLGLLLVFYGPSVIFSRAHAAINQPELRLLILFLFLTATALVVQFGLWMGMWFFSFILTFLLFQKPGKVLGWIAYLLKVMGWHKETNKK